MKNVPTFPAQQTRAYAYLISFVAALGGLLLGFDVSIIEGALIFLRKEFALTPVQLGLAVGQRSDRNDCRPPDCRRDERLAGSKKGEKAQWCSADPESALHPFRKKYSKTAFRLHRYHSHPSPVALRLCAATPS